MPRWFLSYHSPDHALAERLKIAIERKNPEHTVFFAPTSLRVGGFWTSQLAREIADATAFILLVGERGLGQWQVLEYDEALDKRVNSPDFPVVLVLLEGQAAPGLPFLRRMHWIVSPEPASEKDVARLLATAISGTDTRVGELWRYTSPYRGLAAMEERDSDYFFGRERETVEVINALAAAPQPPKPGEAPARRLPVLLGNSGVGKSSLAQAGVLAALKRQAWPEGATMTGAWPHPFQDSRRWCFLALKPGSEPIKALVDVFIDTWQFRSTEPERVKQQNGWIELLRDGKAALRDLLDATERRYHELERGKPSAFFLYVDQGEELYARSDERQRRRFSELLAQGLYDPRLLALMSLRADFLGALQNDEALYRVHRKIDVPPLRETELREVVTRPAALLSARFESDGLAADIARRTAEESAKDAGALPLLSYLLDDMWTAMVARGDGVLRLPAQAMEVGGVLAERANAFLARNPHSEETLRRVLTLKLATVREDGEPTRRRALRSEFSDEEWRLVSELADHPNRLLITASPEGGETYAEVAHEAIFRRWKKLRDWMAAEREFLVWRGGLEADRRRWEAAPESARNDALLMGLALAQAQSWLVRRAEDLPKADREFIDLSLKRELLERQYREKVRRRVLGSAVVALAVMTVLAVFSILQWREADRQRLEAVKQEQTAQQERNRAQKAVATFAIRLLSMPLDSSRASQDLDQAIMADPTDATSYYLRGIIYFRMKDFDRFIADLDKVIELDPKFPFSYIVRGHAFWYKKDYDQAIADYDQAIKLDPSNTFAYDWYYNRGWVYSDKKDYDRAIVDYDQATRLNPKYAPAFVRRGHAYYYKGDYDRAIADYDRAINLDPNNASAYDWYYNRGWVYSDKKDFDRAIADYDQALRLNPKHAPTYSRRGLAYYYKMDYDRAIADYNQAINLDPNYVLSYVRRGHAYYYKKDYDSAIANYSEAIKLDPSNAAAYDWYFNRGWVYADKQDYQRVIADYDQSIKLNVSYSPAYYRRGHSYFSMGDYGRAVADYSSAIEIDPAEATAWRLRCWVRAVVNQVQQALADCNEAAKLEPNNVYVLNSRGFAYLKSARYPDAIADYDAVLRLSVNNAEALFGRGFARLRGGDSAGGNADIAAAKAIRNTIAEEFAGYGVR